MKHSLLLASLAVLGMASAALPDDVRQACKADFASYCSGVKPGGGRIVACMRQNADKLSPGCKAALAARKNGG